MDAAVRRTYGHSRTNSDGRLPCPGRTSDPWSRHRRVAEMGLGLRMDADFGHAPFDIENSNFGLILKACCFVLTALGLGSGFVGAGWWWRLTMNFYWNHAYLFHIAIVWGADRILF